MGENAEIYGRLGKLETDIATLNERVKWMGRLVWLLFPSGGLVGWALARTFGG